MKVDERRTDTREQIQTTALELLAEHGYDGTSLRQIAERLGLTKAAVYYHFKTKEEILASLLEDFLGQVHALAEWGGEQPAGPATRQEVLRRYSELLSGRTVELARFVQEGQAAIRDLAVGEQLRTQFRELARLIAPDDRRDGHLRARVALIALHVATFSGDELGIEPGGHVDAALGIAAELIA